jgi:Na+/H+-dicarboxylate symporter
VPLDLVSQWQEGARFAEIGVYVSGLVGGVFVDLLKMVLIPLVFSSIAVGIANLRAHDAMHRVWRCAVVYF